MSVPPPADRESDLFIPLNLTITESGSTDLLCRETQPQITKVSETANNCGICYEDFTNKTILDPCTHAFCKECITTWVKSSATCPYCRGVISQLQYSYSSAGEYITVTTDEIIGRQARQNPRDFTPGIPRNEVADEIQQQLRQVAISVDAIQNEYSQLIALLEEWIPQEQ
jgi:hypothetical protein